MDKKVIFTLNDDYINDSHKKMINVLERWRDSFIKNGDYTFMDKINSLIDYYAIHYNDIYLKSYSEQLYGYEIKFKYPDELITCYAFFNIDYIHENYTPKKKSTKSIFSKYVPEVYTNSLDDPSTKLEHDPIVLLKLNSIIEYKVLDGNHKLEYLKRLGKYSELPVIELSEKDIQSNTNIFVSNMDFEFFNLWVEIKSKYP